NNVPVGQWRLLEGAGVHGKENRDNKEWHVYLIRGSRWVKVKAFSWDMETEKGKVRLDRPVFPYKGELIVPLRQVAESLGISVQQKGQTIALLPK
ncbi:MAG: stalk domain-containing protein, partial [Armatimonadota bacterium]|nr:stalk domain-containing protein [Armatimonadota bacterium]